MNRLILTAVAVLASGLLLTSNIQADGETKTMNSETAVTLINPFEVPADKLDEAIAMWEQARDYLMQQPGYISTELHQAMAPDAPFPLVNVAKWESIEAFMSATKNMQAEGNIPRIEGVRGGPQLYTVIRN